MENVVRWVKQNQQVVILSIIFGIVILIFGGVLFSKQAAPQPTENLTELMSEEPILESSEFVTVYADIKGAVSKPGMYQIETNARVLDLVNMAGGFTAEAAQDQVNFSQLVEDQMVIYVPTSAEDLQQWQERQIVAEIPTKSAAVSAKVNLNTADTATLQQLNGVGEKKAAAIIAYREENGSFKSIDELKKVAGIGDKTFENLKAEIEI